MKKKFFLLAVFVAFFSEANAVEVSPFVQHVVTNNAKIEDHEINYGIQKGISVDNLYRGFGFEVSMGEANSQWDTLNFNPGSYTASEYTSETAGEHSTFTPATYHAESSVRGHHGRKFSRHSSFSQAEYTPETAGTPSSYKESKYEPASASISHTRKDIKITKLVVTYSHKIYGTLSGVVGAGTNIISVDGESANAFTGIIGIKNKTDLGNNFSINESLLYNYDEEMSKFDYKPASSVSARLSLAYSF